MRTKIYLGGTRLEELEGQYNALVSQIKILNEHADVIANPDEKQAFVNEQVNPVQAEKARVFKELEEHYEALNEEIKILKEEADAIANPDEKKAFMNTQVKPVFTEKTRLFELIKKERDEIDDLLKRIDKILWDAYGTDLTTDIARTKLREIDTLFETNLTAKDDIKKNHYRKKILNMIYLLSSSSDQFKNVSDMGTFPKNVLEEKLELNRKNFKVKEQEMLKLSAIHKKNRDDFRDKLRHEGANDQMIREKLKDMDIRHDNERKVIRKQMEGLTIIRESLETKLKKIQLQERAEERKNKQDADNKRALAKSEKQIEFDELRRLEEEKDKQRVVGEGEGGVVGEDEDEEGAPLTGKAFRTDQETSASAEQKLIITTPLPPVSGYDVVEAPEFWKPVFQEGEMLYIRSMLQDIISSEQGWKLCEIIKQNIKTYYYVVDLRKQTPRWLSRKIFGTFPPENHIKFNLILCATFIILGIISNKLANQDYKLLFKGGKAIQLALDGIAGSTEYNSEDIDCLLMPKDGVYNLEEIKNLAGHIAYLVEWFLKTDKQDISVLPPRENPFIFKLSYKFRAPYSKSELFAAFSDIDFRQIPEDIKLLFEDTVSKSFKVDELDQVVLFEYPSIETLLNEKIYYYLKYFMFKEILKTGGKITNPEYSGLTEDECNRILEKFKRAILILTNAMYTEVDSRRKSIADRLNNNPLTSEIIASLY